MQSFWVPTNRYLLPRITVAPPLTWQTLRFAEPLREPVHHSSTADLSGTRHLDATVTHRRRTDFRIQHPGFTMRKRVNMHRLGRDMSHRLAMLRNMVTSFIYHERIRTTVPRAKELRKMADNMVTLAKKGTPHHQRQAQGIVRENAAVVKLFEVLGPRYKDRPGGYTRVMKLQKPRKGDQADMAIIEFVDREGELRPARQVGQTRGLVDLVEDDFLTKDQKRSSLP